MGAVARVEVGEAGAEGVGEGVIPALFDEVMPKGVAAFVLQRVTVRVVGRSGDRVEWEGKPALEQDKELGRGDGGGGVRGDGT